MDTAQRNVFTKYSRCNKYQLTNEHKDRQDRR